MAQDDAYAVSCFEKELARDPSHVGSNNQMGKAYFYGRGVPQDYAKAYQMLTLAHDRGNTNWGAYYLAKCCFHGWGTPQDYQRALQYLNEIDWKNREADYMRGVIYGRGLGVEVDIPKGVSYLQKAGDLKEAKEERTTKRPCSGSGHGDKPVKKSPEAFEYVRRNTTGSTICDMDRAANCCLIHIVFLSLACC